MRGVAEVFASCSCPFAATDGWCKHCRACLLSAVDAAADEAALADEDAAAGDAASAAAAAPRATPPRALPWLGGAHADSARPPDRQGARLAERADEPGRRVRRKLERAGAVASPAATPAPAEPTRWWEAGSPGASASDESDGGA